MKRTPEQEIEYQDLTSHGKVNYDSEVRENPSASHDDCMLVALASQSIRDLVREGGRNINIKDNRVKKRFLERLNNLIHNEFPRIWGNVKDTFRAAMDYLGSLIEDGIIWTYDNVISPVIDFLDEVFG